MIGCGTRGWCTGVWESRIILVEGNLFRDSGNREIFGLLNFKFSNFEFVHVDRYVLVCVGLCCCVLYCVV